MPSTGIYNPANQNLLPTLTQVRKETTKWLRSKREQICHKVKHQNRLELVGQVTAKPNIRVKRSCIFCGSNGPEENVKTVKRGNTYREF